jgi:hypothetical protein
VKRASKAPMAVSSSETENALMNRLVADLGGADDSRRLAAQETWKTLSHGTRVYLFSRLLAHRDRLRISRPGLVLPYLSLLLLGTGSILVGLFAKSPGLFLLFGVSAIGRVLWDFVTRERNLASARRYDAWLDTLQDARLTPYVLPPLSQDIWNKDHCAMPSRAKILKRLLPQLTEDDFRAWTPEQRDRLFHLLDKLNAFYDIDLTVAILSALPKLDDRRVPDYLRHFSNYTHSDFFFNGPLERASTIVEGVVRINEAARNAQPQDILLRAANAPVANAPKELLRPATSSETTPPEQLLRPLE